MSSPTISVIVPVYNGEAYLQECLQSIQAQSFKDFEVLIVDDGSKDGTEAIAKSFTNKDSRFTLISQENAGPGVARNNAISQAKGVFIYCCDADDFLKPAMFDRLISIQKKTDADMVITGFFTFNQQCKKGFYAGWGMPHTDKYSISGKDTFSGSTNPDYFFETVQNIPWNKLVRKDLLKENSISFQEIYLTEDLMYSLPAALCAKKIARTNEALLYHREFLQTNAMANKGSHPEDVVIAFTTFKKWLEEKGLYPTYEKSYQNWLLNGLHYNLPFYKDFEKFVTVFELIKENQMETIGLASCSADSITDPRYKMLLEALKKDSVGECLLGIVNLLAVETQTMDCEFQGLQRNPKWLLSNLKHIKD